MSYEPISVSELNKYVKEKFDEDDFFSNILVEGEISNLKVHYTGHIYFTLKDEKSLIKSVMFKTYAGHLDFKIQDGMKVMVLGSVSVFERDGTYQLYAKAIKQLGKIGDLRAAFEELKEKLEKEGLFDVAHKQKIPIMPKIIGVLTSNTGAVIRDIINVSTRRNPNVQIRLYPVPVQGEGAGKKIADAIKFMNEKELADVLIIARGGGSLEDLWPFNEECVARAIYDSKIPTISAIGHETDFTIADFVADLRAETPTAAAEKAVPDTSELREYVDSLHFENKRNLKMILENVKKHLQLLDPKVFGRDLQSRVAMDQMRTDSIMEYMTDLITSMIKDYKYRLMLLKETLDGADPKAILKKGYSVITDEKGSIVKDASTLEQDQLINIESAVGHAKARVVSSGKEN